MRTLLHDRRIVVVLASCTVLVVMASLVRGREVDPDERRRRDEGSPIPCEWFDSEFLLVGERHSELAGRIVALDLLRGAAGCARVPQCLFTEVPHDATRGGEYDYLLEVMSSFASAYRLELHQVDVATDDLKERQDTYRGTSGRSKRAARFRYVVERSREMSYRILASGCTSGLMQVGRSHLDAPKGTELGSVQEVLRVHGRSVLVLDALCAEQVETDDARGVPEADHAVIVRCSGRAEWPRRRIRPGSAR